MTETDWNAEPDGETPEQMARVLDERRAREDHEAIMSDMLWNRFAGHFDAEGRVYAPLRRPPAVSE